MVDFPHKIVTPQRPNHLVPRPRLTHLVNAIMERRLVTISAPAGYGKTSLLIDFANADPPLPVCWYTLDHFDVDPWVFLNYLVAAVERQFPGAAKQTSTLLNGQGRPSFPEATAAIVHDFYTIGHDFILVIDDWHIVDAITDISDLVAHLLIRCPNCHIILASRIYPGLPDIMLLAARRQMSGLDEAQLRFTGPEAAEVLAAEHLTNIPSDKADALVDQANGWITGILLAFQSAGTPMPTLVPAERRAERQIYLFLTEQVFDRQSPAVQSFLLESSLLDELTPERCDQIFARTDSGILLETLLRNHIFITQVDAGVLRYHPLFREFLQEHFRKTDPQRYRNTARQVADAYAAQEHWVPAFQTYIAAGDLTAAQQIVARGGEQLYMSGRLETLERWFQALPIDDLDAPLLCLKARVLLDRGRNNEAQVLADLAQVRTRPGEEPGVLLTRSLLARVFGRYEEAIALAEHVASITHDAAQQASALRTMAICYHLIGQSILAIQGLQKALDIERQLGDLYTVALLQNDLGVCHEEMGLLHIAEEYHSHADAYWATIGDTGRRALSLNSKGVVQHLTGRHKEAHTTFRKALVYAREAAIPYYQALVLTSLGDLYSDLRLWTQAHDSYVEAHQFDSEFHLTSYLDLAVVQLTIRQGQYEVASHKLGRLSTNTISRQGSSVQLLQSRIAFGMNDYEQAMRETIQAIGELERGNAPDDLARAYILQAQIVVRINPTDTDRLIESLQRAAQIADQIGHDAFLIVETLQMPSILRRAHAAGWERAAEWLQRHQDILLASRMISHDDQRPVLVVRTLGTDQISLNGNTTEIGWQKAREVFYYLLAHPDGATSEALREAIWPDLSPQRSRGTLKTAIYQLRLALPRELIELHGRQTYRVNRDMVHIDYDLERFLTLLDTRADDPEKLLEAIDLYRGLYLPWSENNWSSSLRAYLEQRYLHTLRFAAEWCEQHEAYPDALIIYQRILTVDAMDEAAHAGVMRCQVALGNRAAAIDQYRFLRRILDEELGLELGRTSEVEQLYHRILAAS